MNTTLLTINQDIEERALSHQAGQWFTVAQLNGVHVSRVWLHLADLAQRRFHRPDDNALLISNQADRYAFSWLKQEA